ncbi:MAG: FtsQ-type POTRA domain-containing protein [Candidatus Moranbacteria bacterium]|nr:FtsQ-type POTRA domain-containing protein [Candidatus Moranbacteria bacterium]
MMRFLWKTQLKKEHGKFLPQAVEKKKKKREASFGSTEERALFFGGIFLWSLFLGTVVYVGVFSPYLKYSDWQVTGLTLVEEERVRETIQQKMDHKYLGFIPGDTFFVLQPRVLELLLREQYPLFQKVLVKRVFPHTLTVIVEERPTILLWCSVGVCAHVLENGDTVSVTDVYQQGENQSRTVVIEDRSGQPIRFGEKTFESYFASRILLLREQLRDRFDLETESSFSFTSRFANEIRLRTMEGWEVYFSTLLAPEASLQTFALVYDDEIPKERLSQLEYIDLRTENRIFYRFKNSDEAEKQAAVPEAVVVPAPTSELPEEKKKSKKKE